MLAIVLALVMTDVKLLLRYRYAPKPRFKTPRKPYTASLEALLVGHEDWVHSVQWQPPTASSSSSQRAKHAQHDLNLSQQDHQQDADGEADAMQVQQQDAQHSSLDLTESQHAQRAQHDTGAEQPLCLLSTSMDRTMMLWRPDPATGQFPETLAQAFAPPSDFGLCAP